MENGGIRDAAAWRGRGAVHAFTVRYDRWRLSALLEADEADTDSPRLLEHARTGLMSAVGAAWTGDLDPALFLQKVLAGANRETWYRIRTNPMWADRFVCVLISLTDGDQVWLGQAGHGRVLGGDTQGFRELVRPQTAAARMVDDGTAPSWDEAPENLRRSPLQGLGLPPQDFAPKLKGPIPRNAAGVLLLTSFEVGELAHHTELGNFLGSDGTDEEGLGRLLDYCRSRDASADVGAVLLTWGGPIEVLSESTGGGAPFLPEDEETWQEMDHTARGDPALLRNLLLILLAVVVVGLGVWWITTLDESTDEPEAETPTAPPPLESLYRGDEVRPSQDEPPAAGPLPEERELPPLRPLDEVDPTPVPVPIIHKVTDLQPESESEPVHEIKVKPKPKPKPKRKPKPKPRPKPKPKPEPVPEPEPEPEVEPEPNPSRDQAPGAQEATVDPDPDPEPEFVPRMKLPERDRALDHAPDEEEPEIGPDGVMVMDFTGDDDEIDTKAAPSAAPDPKDEDGPSAGAGEPEETEPAGSEPQDPEPAISL